MECLRRSVFALVILIGCVAHAEDPTLWVGDKEYQASKATGSFDGSGYSVSWTGSGFQISFYGDSIIRSESETAISSGKDISICMADGVTVVVDGRNSGISAKNVVIKGSGTLTVLTRSVGLLNNNDGIRARGDVLITLGATVNVMQCAQEWLGNGLCISASGKVTVGGAMANLTGYYGLISGYEGVSITASLVNIVQGAPVNETSSAVSAGGGHIRIVGSIVSLESYDTGFYANGMILVGQSCVGVVSSRACFAGSPIRKMSFQDSSVVAVSATGNVVSMSDVGYPENIRYRDEDGVIWPTSLFVGNGRYHFGTCANRTCLLGGVRIEIDGGVVECCAPNGTGAYSYEFDMKSGSFSMVDKMDYKDCYKTIMSEAFILSTVAATGIFENWYGLKSSLFVSMCEQFLLTQCEKPKGAAKQAIIADSYRQYGGEVKQGSAEYGYLASRFAEVRVSVPLVNTPALLGGVFHGQMGALDYNQDYKALNPTNRNGTAYVPTDGYPYWELSSPNRLIVFEPGENGKGVPQRTSVRAKSVATLPNQLFTRSGYRQTGWAETEDGPQKYAFGQKLTVSSDLLLYPSWIPTFYTITYSGGGGGGSMPDQACEPHRVYRLQPNAFSADGVKMVGWRNMTNGKLYDDQLLVFDLAAAGETVAMMAEWDPQAKTYMIIDVSGGTDARSYPVSYRATVPEGGWSDEYKTDRIVLRKIEPGVFEKGLHVLDYPGFFDLMWTRTTISEPYYIGVFEVTQRQWELVMGTRPSCFSNETYYATRPVEMVRDALVLGDDASFIECLKSKTGLKGFNLPSENEWEYACRAGTKTALNNGKNILSDGMEDEGANEVARYAGNNASAEPDRAMLSDRYRYHSNCDGKSGTAPVGSYLPNAWGLYDMHGNVYEYCRDRFPSGSPGSGTSSGETIVRYVFAKRGGSWIQGPRQLCSGDTFGRDLLSNTSFTGFRLYFSEHSESSNAKPGGAGTRK